jgi:hypothetical protein
MKAIIKLTRYIQYIVLLSSWIVVLWTFTLPSMQVSAQNEDCNQFWGTCGIEDIKTLHTDKWPSSQLLDTVKNAINWILWILATVALCICMFGGFKMLTSGADGKWYKDGWTILKNAAIWLAIILLAWMIVSVVFWFVGTLSSWNQTKWAS